MPFGGLPFQTSLKYSSNFLKEALHLRRPKQWPCLLSPVSQLSTLPFQDHLLSISLPTQRALYPMRPEQWLHRFCLSVTEKRPFQDHLTSWPLDTQSSVLRDLNSYNAVSPPHVTTEWSAISKCLSCITLLTQKELCPRRLEQWPCSLSPISWPNILPFQDHLLSIITDSKRSVFLETWTVTVLSLPQCHQQTAIWRPYFKYNSTKSKRDSTLLDFWDILSYIGIVF